MYSVGVLRCLVRSSLLPVALNKGRSLSPYCGPQCVGCPFVSFSCTDALPIVLPCPPLQGSAEALAAIAQHPRLGLLPHRWDRGGAAA